MGSLATVIVAMEMHVLADAAISVDSKGARSHSDSRAMQPGRAVGAESGHYQRGARSFVTRCVHKETSAQQSHPSSASTARCCSASDTSYKTHWTLFVLMANYKTKHEKVVLNRKQWCSLRAFSQAVVQIY